MLSDKVVAEGASFDDDAYYEIRVSEVYKGASRIRKLLGKDFQTRESFKIKLHTQQSLETCGANLNNGGSYFLAGSITRVGLVINMCNSIKPFGDLSNEERKGISGGYKC